MNLREVDEAEVESRDLSEAVDEVAKAVDNLAVKPACDNEPKVPHARGE